MRFVEKHRLSISFVLGITLSVIVIIAWHLSNRNLTQSLQDKVTVTNQLLAQQFQNTILDNVNKLKNLKRRLEITDGSYFDYWNKDAALIINQNPSFKFIEWINEDGVIKLVEPLAENKEAIGLDITKLDYRRKDWNKARRDSVFNLTHWLELVQGDFSFLVDAPVYINQEFKGTISAGIDPSQQFDKILSDIDQYHVTIKDEQGTTFYAYGDSVSTERLKGLSVIRKIPIPDARGGSWTITTVPNLNFLNENSRASNILPLVLALVLCFFLALSFFLRQKYIAATRSQTVANRKLRSLIDSSPLGICIIDKDGIVTDFWNEAAEQIFGWKREEVIGQTVPFVSEEYREEFQQNLQRCIDERGLKNQEVERLRKDGSKGIFLINVGMIPEQDQMLVLIEDITEVKKYQQELKKSLSEKEFLLTEIHHRVKNNLAIIVGLIELQKDKINDNLLERQLNETQNRIYSISGVHELLYQAEDFTEINLAKYIDKLLNRLEQTYQGTDRPVIISKKINDLNININQAIPLGLLLNELITNSFKHAFDGIQTPRITVSIEEADESIVIKYSDNGRGMKDSAFEEKDSLGMNLIQTLLTQLDANYELGDREEGFSITFSFTITQKGSHSNL